MTKQLGSIITALFAGIVLVSFPMISQAVGETSDAECTPYYQQCGCNQIPDKSNPGKCISGGANSNTHGCPAGICSDLTNGVNSGVCVAQGKCQDVTTDGKAPVKATPQQTTAANNGTSANGTVAPTSGGGGAGSPAISSNSTAVVPPTGQTNDQPGQTTQQTAGGLTAGTSVIGNAYSWATGLDSSAAQYQGGQPNGPDTSQPTAQSSWLTDAQQAQLQSSVAAPPLQTDQNFQQNPTTPLPVNPGFAQDQTTPGSLGPTPQEVAGDNALVTMTPSELAAQDLQAIQDTAKSVGGWTESALIAMTTPDATPASQLTSQDLSDMRATIYTPGTGGTNGGLYGSNSNYLDPSIPTVAAGYDSGLKYGDVVQINNLTTGAPTYAVVGDVCPGCGSGIDLTPTAANQIGLTMQQGVGNVQAGVVASTGSYADGAQLAASLNNPPDPWSGPQAGISSIGNTGVLGVATVNDYANSAIASTQYTNDQLAASSAANAQEAQGLDSNSDRPTGLLSANDTTEAISAADKAQATAVQNQPEQISALDNTGNQVSTRGVVTDNGSDNTGVTAPEGKVDNGGQLAPVTATLQEAPSTALMPISGENGGGLSSGTLTSQDFSNMQLSGAEFAENGPANPSGVVEQGPALEQPNPSGTVTGSDLSLSDQEIAANVPVPEPADVSPPTQAEMQADLLKQGQDFSALNANSFYQAVQGSQFAEAGPAISAGTVETGAELPEPGQPNPSGVVTSAPLPLSDQQIAANIPTPEMVETNPQAVVEATNQQESDFIAQQENGALNDRLAQADEETTANEQALQNADSKVPVPDTNLLNNVDLTDEIAHQVAAETPIAQSVPTPQVEQSDLPPIQTSLSDKLSSAMTSAENAVQGWYQSSVDAVQQYAFDKSIPPATTYDQTGQQVTSNIQQTVSQETEAALAPTGGQTDQTLAEVTNSDRTFTALGIPPSDNEAATNGTTITSAMFSPNSVALGASSYNTDVAQAVEQATQFNQAPIPASDVPLPESRPAEAGATGIDLNGCGGVCEVGNTGADVKAIQEFLNNQGNSLKVDGIYGPQTEAAVETYQKGNSLQVDGVVGPQTLGSMNSVAATENALVPATQSGQDVTNQVLQAATQQQAQLDTSEQQQSAEATADKPEATYTLSNAGDLRGDFLVNPVTAALIPDSMKQQLIEANETGAQTVTFSQSQLDSIKWGLMSGPQATQVQNLLAQAGYQVPSDVVISDRPSGIEDIANLQQLAQQRATAMTSLTNNLSGGWSGF